MKKIIIKYFRKNPIFLLMHDKWFSSDRKKTVQNTLKELNKIVNYNDTSLKALNDSKLTEILRHAYDTVPYYKEVFDNYNFDPAKITGFSNLPILTKEIIRRENDRLLSTTYPKGVLVKNFTSGSTGEPTEFYRDKLASEKDNAHHWYCYGLMGYKPGDRIVGCFGRNIPDDILRKNTYWAKNFGSQIFGEYTLSAHYLNDDTIVFYIEKLLKLKPAIIRGYPSAVNKLALYIIQEKIYLGFKVKGVNLTSEVCTEEQRKNIEEAFETLVYLEYGNKEVCMFSYTKDNTYIYQPSPIYCYLEVINEDGTETEVGDTGKVITTGFINKGMPFVRYDTGDLAIVASRNGGIVHLEKVVGRDHDYLIDKNGDKFYQIRLNSSFYIKNLEAFKEIKIWQFRQSKIGETDVLIIPTDNFTERHKETVEKSFSEFRDLKFNLKYVDDIPKPKSGKHLFFVRQIEDN